jgi:Cys-tRNA(Pro) deacylase
MGKSTHVSETPATQLLRKHGIDITEHVFEYVDHGGTRVSSAALGVDEHHIVKTLVMEDDKKAPLLVLMHGDKIVSTKNLARQANRKFIEPCKPDVAQRHSGYLVGGTSPYGVRKSMPLFMERSILTLPKIYINGGKRGFLVGIDPNEIVRTLAPTLVDVALDG